MSEETNTRSLQQFFTDGEESKPSPQELVDICKEGIRDGKPNEVIQNEIRTYCIMHREKVQDTGRMGFKNLRMHELLRRGMTVSQCLRDDPEGCELDYMTDEEVKNYLKRSGVESDPSELVQGWARIARTPLENDLHYLAFKGRI